MSARRLREILDSSHGEIDPVAFARVVLGSEERLVALMGGAGATLDRSSAEAQNFIRAATAVLREAVNVNPDEAQVLRWFNCERLTLFNNKTPAEVAVSDLVVQLIDYVKSLDAGWTG